MTKYVKWRKPRGGVKKENGDGRTCIHCGRTAVHTATRKQGKFRMAVWFCDTHALQAKTYGS